MAKFYLSALLVRLVLPAGFLISIALRPFGLSLIYLLLYLLAPLTQVPNSHTITGWRGKIITMDLVISFLLLISHAVWHTVLATTGEYYGAILQEYPIVRDIGHNLGYVSYAGVDVITALHYLSPELVMSGTSLLVYLAVRRLLASRGMEELEKTDEKHQNYPLLTSAGKYMSLFLIMFSGIMWPSVTSGLYFLIFIGAATAWAMGEPLNRGFAVVGRCLMAIMAIHILGLMVYQSSWLTDLYPPQMEFARYFGLTQLVYINTTNTMGFKYTVTEELKWPTFTSPFVILFTYFVLAIETRELFKPKVAYKYIDSKALRGSSRDTSPLIRNISPSKRWSSIRSRKSQLHQDSTGSVVVPDEESEKDEEPTLIDDIIAAVIDFFQILIRSSYIATTITMMAWSIMYHSWLAFVFLMWANLVWLCQNQRSFMLKTSPVLVCYAIILLLIQYIYSMDLTEQELPSNVTHVNLKQIGVSRPEGAACLPLLIKSLFTCMFWVTLRQRVQEIRQRRQSTIITDMAGPLQLTISTAGTAVDSRDQEERSRLMRIFGEWLRAFCARYWIYVVVIMLFIIGITGDRMTIFRIIYMFLFLWFILLFQLSWHWWRRLMYLFWVTVIVYSMINLILLYIYQFDNFSKTIEDNLRISEKLQHDLGLEPYIPAELFVKLLTPTLFLIITIMQVHYFHRDFMALSDPNSTLSQNNPGSNRPSNAGASTIKDDVPPLPLEEEPQVSEPRSLTDFELSTLNTGKMQQKSIYKRTSDTIIQSGQQMSPSRRHFKQWFKRFWKDTRARLSRFTEVMFVSLDIHIMKIILVALMLLCVMNVCAMHVPIMIVICLAWLMNSKQQQFCVHLISLLISIYLMAIMVYQIDYIQHDYFDVNCTTLSVNQTELDKTYNNAEWIGFVKAVNKKPLPVILKGYIALIAVFTINSLVSYRQQAKSKINPMYKEKMMFRNITREDADKDLIHCIKYLIDYGFYKFGVEISLICLMGVIGSRMDLYAVLYSVWLLTFVSVKRTTQAKMWPSFTAYIIILIPIQYMISVGFLPQFCLQYPWRGYDQKHLRTWLFLPHPDNPPHATKLIFDFFLLLFTSRQLKVFRIEKKYGDSYPGGSNSEDVGTDWETPNFVNPVPDFLVVVGNWLDTVKRMVFLGMLWVTLAIMFLTGTNRVNLFSMGYLIGSFIFLWQGTDFYLLPKEAILQWWSWLVRYNVAVVVIKALLQIPGCIFSSLMQENACWLVQLLGIGCVDKFAGGNVAGFLKMSYNKNASSCTVPQEDIGLAWDGVCFAFLILQRRLFQSYYFYRVIDESKATTILASRGAELIEELRQKQMRLQEDEEVKILEKIKIKMERIKANQKKIQGAMAKEPVHHDAARVKSLYKAPASHQKAVRSGDYYMFDEFDDTDVHLKDDESTDDEDVPKNEMSFGKTPSSSRGVAHERDVTMSERERDDDETELEEYAPSPDDETKFETFKRYMSTAWAFITSMVVTITRYLMKYSRDYRYVSRTLAIEKKILKEKEGFGIGIREGSQMVWEPLPETLIHHKDVTTLEEQDDSVFRKDSSPFSRLGYALWYAVLAHTDIVCYIMVFINQIQSATILSIPLPLMVFLWGTLTIPRPTKTFWVTLIAYTEVIVLIKSMFQFEILPWNNSAIPENMPFTAPRVIGIERKSDYALYDLLLLLIIFLHRFMLKSLGLWKESTPEIELREDTEYPLTAEDTQMVVEGHAAEVGHKYIKLHDRTGPGSMQESDNSYHVDDADQQPGPSKPSENDHYEAGNDEEPIIAVKTTLEETTIKDYPNVIVLSMKRYLQPVSHFFRRMLMPGARVTADVYAYMFLCDFINFLVIIFGFAAFGTQQGDGGVQAYLEENKVPIPFLIMLILQFGLIVIDRSLYLRKFMLGKILFQYALVIGVHIWMFFVLPFITERKFNALPPPPIWYMVKCVYLLLSAYQIRCGYPRRIIGNFLCKSYRFLNMVFFRGFMAVPFVFELRTLMDWIWTDTSMTLMDWLKMEDIFASVFLLKCSRYIEDEYPQPRGVKKASVSKYLLGGSVLAFVIAIIWFPLVFFAFGNSVGESNPPTDVTVKIRIGPFLPVYQMSAQSHNIDIYSEQDYNQLSNLYPRDRTAQTFLANYMYNDVAVITINPNSTMTWDISPPELKRLESEAASNASLTIKFSYVITHKTNAALNPPTIESNREVPLDAYLDGKQNPERVNLLKFLNNSASSDTWINVKTLFPKFVKVFNKGVTKAASQLMPDSENEDMKLYRDVKIRLERDNGSMYWRVRESCGDADELAQRSLPMNNCDMLVMYTFNDKLFPETLNFISASGIIGLYTTFVFLASRVLRGFFSGIYTKIMFDDLPNVDRVLQLCLDIYLVREALELSLEEDLFAKLVFLYRSPETMIKWSRPREDEDERRALPPP